MSVIIDSHDRFASFRCSRGHDNAGPVESTIGELILMRAQDELTLKKDFAMSIVLSATALECELSALHNQHELLGALEKGQYLEGEQLEEMLRRFRSVSDKINHVARLLHAAGLDHFVAQSPELSRGIREGFPSIDQPTLAESFRKALFYPRNHILHVGQRTFTYEDGLRALNVAKLGLFIFAQMGRGQAP